MKSKLEIVCVQNVKMSNNTYKKLGLKKKKAQSSLAFFFYFLEANFSQIRKFELGLQKLEQMKFSRCRQAVFSFD